MESQAAGRPEPGAPRPSDAGIPTADPELRPGGWGLDSDTPEHAGEHAGMSPGVTSALAPEYPAPIEPAGRDAARRFIGRLARLDHGAAYASIQTWHQVMRDESLAWFAAEEAAARAVVAAGRHAEQKPLLVHIADAFAHRVWYRGQAHLAPGAPAPELQVRASEASGQYVATVAMLALLVRDHLAPATFDLLYRPFAALVPLTELGRE